MTTHSVTQGPGRLNGWKEIAAYCDRGVRTVQRWERELNLPVHRLRTAKGDSVFALPQELDEWMRQISADDRREPRMPAGPASEPPASKPSPTDAGDDLSALPAQVLVAERPPRRWLYTVITLGLAMLVIAVGSIGFPQLPGWKRAEPARMLVDLDTVRALDARGKELWHYRFDYPLHEDSYLHPAVTTPHPWLIEDIDNDGSREVLFLVMGSSRFEAPIYCFEADGRLRFTWSHRVSVNFGGIEYQPPFRVLSMLPGTRNRTPVIWTAAAHQPYFPAVVTALDAKTGRPQSQFWHPGHLTAFETARMFGRDVLLVGGVDNELKRPILLVIDAEASTGSMPVSNDYYRCKSCPPSPPLAAVSFPLPDSPLLSLDGGLSGVIQIAVNEAREIFVGIQYPAPRLPGELAPGRTLAYYTFSSDLQPLRAELKADYGLRHRVGEALRIVDHPFDEEAESARLFPVHVLDGTEWVPRSPK